MVVIHTESLRMASDCESGGNFDITTLFILTEEKLISEQLGIVRVSSIVKVLK